ncbi:MAG: hypothetical protein C0599_00290 [Salinivirgaceae bacterium]|nr:MAG: hypothetical protein C0599_00290 [Salinivirgaceae bacterium]
MHLNAQKLPDSDWKIQDADILGNFYFSDGTDLVKTKVDGTILDEYQDQLLGDIYQIDCYKGLKVLVFHQTTNNVLILDNQLAPLGEAIDLSDGMFYDIAAVCLGADDKLWIADEQTGQLKLVDRTLSVIQTGVVFRQYTSAEKIVRFVNRGNLILMTTSDNELLVFDHFGSFISKHSFKSLFHSWLGVSGLFYMSGDQMIKYSYNRGLFDTVAEVGNEINGILESKNQLYLLEENRIKKLK